MALATEGLKAESGTDQPQRYRLISADSHISEPQDLWTSRLPRQYRDRAPRVDSFPEGDAWVVEGLDFPITLGIITSAGFAPEDVHEWVRYSDIRTGGFDPAERLREMDTDGVDAAILYASPRLLYGHATNPDKDFALACVQVYNDWICEYASHNPDRLGAIGALPIWDIDHAVAEFERCAGKTGLRGMQMLSYPNGGETILPEDDRLFAMAADSGLPLNVHVNIKTAKPVSFQSKLPGDVRFYDAPGRILQMMWSGMFDRFPTLNVVFAEVDCGWFPYFSEQVSDRYRRLARGARVSLQRQPSEYFREHINFTYITDTFAVDNRHAIGVRNMMWSDDFPHVGGDWPQSWRTIATMFSGVPAEEQNLILAGNAQRLYGFGR